jgi:Tfp pilus assembly protein PilV
LALAARWENVVKILGVLPEIVGDGVFGEGGPVTAAHRDRCSAAVLLLRGGKSEGTDAGFSFVDIVMAILVMTIVMTSLTYVMYNSLSDVAYSRQRSAALSLANQAIEEVRSLQAGTIKNGMSGTSDPTWSQDPNVTSSCFEGQRLDVNGGNPATSCGATTWTNPTCPSVASTAPSAANLSSPAPLSPHLACYTVDGRTYGVAVYLTGDPNVLPLTVWAVVWWPKPVRGGLESHVVTSTSLSDCLVVGTTCGTS